MPGGFVVGDQKNDEDLKQFNVSKTPDLFKEWICRFK